MTLDNAFLVDLYEINIEVWPIPAQPIPVRHGTKERILEGCDNLARIARKVVFSEANSCRDLFTLRYSTRGDGFIDPQEIIPEHTNQASPADLGRYDDQGKEVTFRFAPEPGVTYHQAYRIYRGFGPGDRDVHFHLHPKTRYGTVVMTLDLRGYVNQGHAVTREPTFHFHPIDPRDHDLCKARGLGTVVKPARVERGFWAWMISSIDGGVIDAVWDVDGPENLGQKPDAEQARVLQLVRMRLTACRVFEHVMKVVTSFGPIPFRQVEEKSRELSPSGPDRGLPLSQSQISKLMPRVEKLLEDPAFFGNSVRLFLKNPGRPAEPSEKAVKALAMLRPYLEALADVE